MIYNINKFVNRSNLIKLFFGCLMIMPLIGCKKNQAPILEVVTYRQNGEIAANTYIYIHTGTPSNSAGTGSGIVDTASFHKRGVTNSSGKITFEFPNSAVLTIEATHITSTPEILIQKKIVSIETRYQSDKNVQVESIKFSK